jgi:inosose dehydratase
MTQSSREPDARGSTVIRLASSPVSWGVDFPDHPGNPPWRDVLSAIAQLGFRWTELGPLGYLPEDATIVSEALQQVGLAVAGSFLVVPLHDTAKVGAVLTACRRTCTAIRAAGGQFLVVINEVSPERDATAGRSDAARRLTSGEWRAFLDLTRRVTAVASEEFDLTPVFHPHAGSYVEFEDEIESLVAGTAADRLQLCLDTGHCAYAGISVTGLVGELGPRTRYLHLKDVSETVLTRARRERWSFWTAVREQIFCPLGTGIVEFGEVLEALARAQFDGWATLEQDRDPTRQANVAADIAVSRDFIHYVSRRVAGGGVTVR